MNTVDILNKNGIRPSITRLSIYSYLIQHPKHPTVEEIFEALLPDIPTLSKTTVYNTIKLLADNDLVKLITIDGQQVRADADAKMHGHFYCNTCKKVYDFPIDNIIANEISDFEIKTKDVYYSGTCKKCLEKNK